MIASLSGNHKLLSKGNTNGIQISVPELIMTFRALTAYCEFCWLLLIHRWQILQSTSGNQSHFLQFCIPVISLFCGQFGCAEQPYREEAGGNWFGLGVTSPVQSHAETEVNFHESRCWNVADFLRGWKPSGHILSQLGSSQPFQTLSAQEKYQGQSSWGLFPCRSRNRRGKGWSCGIGREGLELSDI